MITWLSAGGSSFDPAAPGTIGGTTPGDAYFLDVEVETLTASGQITSTLATGTAPFIVASATVVANLNASLLGGKTFADPGPIGTTPSTGGFTSLVVNSGTLGTAAKFAIGAAATAINDSVGTITSPAATTKALVIQMAASASVSPFEIQASNGSMRAAFQQSGRLDMAVDGAARVQILANGTTVLDNNRETTIWDDNVTGTRVSFAGTISANENVVITSGPFGNQGAPMGRFAVTSLASQFTDADWTDIIAPTASTLFEIRAKSGSSNTTALKVTNGLTSVEALTISSHIITSGTAPGIAAGAELGPSGTVGIAGNDSAGLITITNTDGTEGEQATVAFAAAFSDGDIAVTLTALGESPFLCSAFVSDITASGFNVQFAEAPTAVAHTFIYSVKQY